MTVLRQEVTQYLRRHATEGGDLDAAELIVAEMLGNTARHAAGPVWVTVTLPGESPC